MNLNPHDGKPKKIIQENVKVLAAEKCLLDSKINKIPIHINFCQTIQPKCYLYFDGDSQNNRFEGIEAVWAANNNPGLITVKMKMGKTNVTVRKGDILGTVSTLVDLDPEDEIEKEATWSLPELKEKIDVGEVDPEQKTKINDMIFGDKKNIEQSGI